MRKATCGILVECLVASGAMLLPSGCTEEQDPASTVTPDAGNAADALPDPRRELRAESLFSNTSFEKEGSSGPDQWQCHCGEGVPAACRVTADGPLHGERVLVLPPGCGVFQDDQSFDQTKSARFSLFVRGSDLQASSFGAATIAFDSEYGFDFANGQIHPGPDGWSEVASEPLSTTERVALRMMLVNTGTSDVTIDDLVVVQDSPNPQGALLWAEHYGELSYRKGTEAGELWVPLPLDHASQVPLYVELTVTPASIVDSVAYVSHEEKNWGARIKLVADGEAERVAVSWEAVVLVHNIATKDRSTVYAALGDPTEWLAATPVADAAYPGIVETAASLGKTTDPSLERMLRVVGWTSKAMTGKGNITALDATTVYENRVSSCTGFANLASALGRAIGLPTRAVANYMVGVSQQTHSINELYLGPELGWRRVEPQSAAPSVAEHYAVTVRLVLPSDESAEANANSQTGRWAAPGVPLYTLVEPLAGSTRMTPLWPNHFEDCSACDNRAELMTRLIPDSAVPVDVEQMFARARAAWEVDRSAYLESGGLDPNRMAIRKKALAAKALVDVAALVDELTGGDAESPKRR
ncbi:MAG: transglutaminase domain-containing protein [Pseudomonadota bacterium]